MPTYVIHFYTGSQPWAGTRANVHLTLYGADGESENHRFDNQGPETFESGTKTSFTILAEIPVETLTKVRIGHDNTGLMPAWFLVKLQVEDDTTGEIAEFECNQWFDTATGDSRIIRHVRRNGSNKTKEYERAKRKVEETLQQIHIMDREENVFELAESNHVEGEIPLIEIDDEKSETQGKGHNKYTISFRTGTAMFAGTDANVSVTLYGKPGESEDFNFENKGSTTFENGMTNSFVIGLKLPLQTITQLHVSHDNKGMFPGWFLNEVDIKDDKSGRTVKFPCEQWIEAKSMFDNEIACNLKREETKMNSPLTLITPPTPTRPLKSENIFFQATYTYIVHIVSEAAYGTLSDDDIIFTLYGKEGQSEQQKVNLKKNNTSPTRMYKTITLECLKDLGSLEKIRIGLENVNLKETNSPWILVTVVDPKTDATVVFICDCCLSNGKRPHIPHEHYPVFADLTNNVLASDKDESKDWRRVKETNDVDVRKRSADSPNTPPVVKAVLKLDNVPWPYEKAVNYFTNWEDRKQWDKTFTDIEILEKVGKFSLVKCCLKMPFLVKQREMVLACLNHPGQRYHVQTMCSALHPRAPFDNQNIRPKIFVSGIVVHQPEHNSKFARITVINQIDLGGWMPRDLQVEYLTSTSMEQMYLLKTYFKEQRNGIPRLSSTSSE